MNKPTYAMLTPSQAAHRLCISLWALRRLNLPRLQPTQKLTRYDPAVIEAHLAASKKGEAKTKDA